MTNDLLNRLQRLILAGGKKYYTFVMGRLNEAKLCNFPEIDVYCLISNEDHSIIKPKTFHVPVVTPYELELGKYWAFHLFVFFLCRVYNFYIVSLGLGAHEWSSRYLTSNSSAYMSAEIEVLVTNVERNR